MPVTDKRLTAALLTEDDLPDCVHRRRRGHPDQHASSSPSTSATTPSRTSTRRRSATADFTSGDGGAQQHDRLVPRRRRRRRAGSSATSPRTARPWSWPTRTCRCARPPLDFGVLSDDTLALKVEAELADGTIEERDLILMREGDLVSVVRLTGPRPSDKELLDSVVRVAHRSTSALLADDTT